LATGRGRSDEIAEKAAARGAKGTTTVHHDRAKAAEKGRGEDDMSETGFSKPRAGRGGGLAVALAFVVLGAVYAWPAAAWEIYRGDRLSATLDSTFSLGASWRVQERDNDFFFLGNDPDDPTAGNGAAFFSNADDGNLNYDKGDLYSTSVKGTFELELGYQLGGQVLKDVGGFFRASAFYDFIGNNASLTERTDLASDARHRSSVIDGGVVGAQWIFLDMYVDGHFEVLERGVDLRIGNQVLNWGEALFAPGGVNTISAFDVTKLRIPGSELREALVPAPIVRLGGEIGWGLSLETYYQFHWNRTNVDPTGSYWATSDMVGRAAEGQFFANDPGGTGLPPEVLFGLGAGIPKASDDKPSNQGQWGVALRYFSDRILSEFGLYYIRYHSKTPTVGTDAQIGNPACLGFGAFCDYFRQYAGKIDVIGGSFTTELLSATLAGEISYRWNDPTPIVSSGIALGTAIENSLGGNVDPVQVGGAVREKRLQAVLNLIQSFGPSTRWGVGRIVEFLHADSFSLTSEMAVTHYPDLESQCVSPFLPVLEVGLPPALKTDCVPYAGVGPPDPEPLPGPFPRKSDVDATSAGYQLFLRGEYTNPFGIPITLNPTLGWRHDFVGTAPNQTFIENRKGVTVGLAVDYLQTWGANLTYANFFGGKDMHLVKDRDFVSASVSYRY
jgi:hypothetical protein